MNSIVRQFFVLSFFFMTFQTSLFTQELSLEKLMSYAFPTQLVTSETADYAAWVQNKEGVRNIFFYNDQGKTIQLTDFSEDDGQDISSLVFSPSNDFLYFIRGGAPNRAGEIPNPTSEPEKAKREIWQLELNTKKLKLISAGSGMDLSNDGTKLIFVDKGAAQIVELSGEFKGNTLFTARGGISSLSWSPDDQKIAFVSNRATHSFIGIYNVSTNSIEYLNPSVDYDSNPVWSPNGKYLAFSKIPRQAQNLPFMPRRSALPWSIHLANMETGEINEIWKAKEGDGSAFRFISGDHQMKWAAGDRIVFPYEGEGWTHLWSVKMDGNELKNLTSGKFEVQFVDNSSGSQEIYYSSNEGDIDRQHIWRVNVETGLTRLVTPGKGIQWSPKLSGKSNLVFCMASDGITPAYVAKIEKGRLSNITLDEEASSYPSEELVEPEQVIFTSTDGMSIHGQLFVPKDIKPEDKRPAVLFFHGGSRRQMLLGFHHRGYYHNAYTLNQFLANQGYIVLSVNYRSGIGYGMEFREALNYGARGASEFQDVLGAGLFLTNHPYVDPDRIGLWGGSYGGYLTAMGLAKASDLFAAGVDIHGVHDWNVVINNFVSSYDPMKNQEVAKLAFDSSPMAYIKDWKSPVLLIHGDDDRNVPFSETVDLVESLRRQDVYFEQLIFPDEVHGFLLHSNWLKAYKATFDFFERKLKAK